MEKKDILGRVDHTLLKQTATWEQIETLCREGMEHATASVLHPALLCEARQGVYRGKSGHLHGHRIPQRQYDTAAKVFETEDAVRNGADEIDMVINTGW